MSASIQSPGWVDALASAGLDRLSAPEVAGTIRELTQERRVFLRILERATGWPREPILGWQVPELSAMQRLDRLLPRSRAVVIGEDQAAIAAAATLFRMILVLDPFWLARGVLYAAWHDVTGLTSAHAEALESMAQVGLRLASLHAQGAVAFVPDYLPGSWEPWPMRSESLLRIAPFDQPLATHGAARLLYWGDRLRAVAVASHPSVARPLRALASAGPDLTADPHEYSLPIHLPRDIEQAAYLRYTQLAERRLPWRRWGRMMDRYGRGPAPRAERLAAYLQRFAAPGSPPQPWTLGVGAESLPDVSLVLRRATLRRPLLAGLPGEPIPLRRRPIYLVPGSDASER